jgi:hypothetical protein
MTAAEIVLAEAYPESKVVLDLATDHNIHGDYRQLFAFRETIR